MSMTDITPLMVAVVWNRLEIVSRLLAHGCSLDIVATGGSYRGCTALDVATRRGRHEAAGLIRRERTNRCWRRVRRVAPIIGSFAVSMMALHAEVHYRPGGHGERDARNHFLDALGSERASDGHDDIQESLHGHSSLWDRVPIELVATSIANALALEALPAVVRLQSHCYQLFAPTLARVATLAHPPFNLNSNLILSRPPPSGDGSVARNATRVHLNNCHLGNDAVETLVVACKAGALVPVSHLEMERNDIGDAGVRALASGCRELVLPNLQTLGLQGNSIGNIGAGALAEAASAGAFQRLRYLDLKRNQIGDEGVAALSRCLDEGNTLPRVVAILLHENPLQHSSSWALRTNWSQRAALTLCVGQPPSA